ncbi:MAG TPA: class I SAM-dependent methyltransferase [Candidatus Dormibacteraeota bacterium]|nr:class I SAM-dependent methyltransferase [Candidatus Dormibacteraeota bacterium]
MTESHGVVSSIYRSGKVYDLLYPGTAAGHAFWLELAQAHGDPVLELMSGTGFITIPLAQAGHDVTGVELAEPMLAEAQRKSEAAGAQVTWVRGDVRAFDLGRRFRLVLLPSNSICHLLTRQDLEACLATVGHHLQPDGRFALNVFVPSLLLLQQTADEELDFGSFTDPESGQPIVMTSRSWYDADTQIKHNRLFRRVGQGPVEPDGELAMRIYFPQELDALLWYNGFAIEHKYGEDRRSFDARSGMQYYVLRLRDRA